MMRKKKPDGNYTIKDSEGKVVDTGIVQGEVELLWTQTTENDRATPDTANLISSLLHSDDLGSMHIPVLDLDIPHHYQPSSTEGHAHLFINKELTGEEYEKLLTVLHELGIIQTGILEQYKRDGMTCARLPGMKKGTETDDL